jgi:polysaccharide chain length determinant protein (PEP-CTERM system associated)
MAGNSEVLSVNDLGAIWARRKMPMLITIIATLLLSSFFAFTLPSIYRSTAHIQIERQEIPSDLVTSGGNEYGADEIAASTQQVMAQENLLSILTKVDLYPDARETLTADELASKLRANINVSTITAERIHSKTGRPLLEAVAFNVSFDDHSPILAQQVAALLAELYLDINRQRRTERAEGVSAFLASEADRLNQNISELEQRLSDFKKQNINLLPESADYNYQMLENAHTQVERQKAQITALQEKQAFLKAELSQSQPTLDELAIARSELAEALQKYTQRHPNVLRLKRTIEDLEQAKASGTGSPQAYSQADNQTTSRLMGQLQAVNSELSAARSQLTGLEKKIEEYESRLTRSPDVEREYLAVSRDYDNALKKYSELRDKEMEARLSEELERAHKADRFSLLNPPPVPANPISPNRVGIIALGLAISLLGSFILASFLEYLDPTVRSADDIKAVLHAPPLGVVPYIGN